MASYNGFIRKSPSGRLAAFFTARRVIIPDDFNWQSKGRGTAFVKDIDGLIRDLPDELQDQLKAELDHLASLFDQNGMLSAEQICAAHRGDQLNLSKIRDKHSIILADSR